MFLWFKIKGIQDTFSLIKTKAVDAKVILVPGRSFSPNNEPSPYVRASFSVASAEEMNTACERFAKLIRS